MTNSELLGALTTALLLGILIGWLWRRLGERRRAARLHAVLADHPDIPELEGQLARLRAELEDAQSQLHAADRESGRRATRCEEELAALHQTLAERDQEVTHLHAELARRRPVPEVEPASPVTAATEAGGRDDLKLIYGIGPVLERLLNGAGITTYRQIAGWTAQDIEDVTARLSVFPDRIERDNWVQGARDEHFRKYGERI